MARSGSFLLVHSDSTEYCEYGTTLTQVNDSVHTILNSEDPDACWGLYTSLTRRRYFESEEGPQLLSRFLQGSGASKLVHGHSTISDTLGIDATEVVGPRTYCHDRAICVDGGVYKGGPCLLIQLEPS